MHLILWPSQFTQRSDFYRQLGQFTGAGLGVIRALEQIQRSPPARSYRPPVRRLLEQLNQGYTLTEAAQRIGGWLPAFDIALLEAGEHSGRLESCFRLLSDYYQDRARIARQMMADLAYPVLLLHLAVFLFPFAQFFTSGNWVVYLMQTFGILLPIYFVAGALIFVAQSSHGHAWRATLENLLRPVPVLGTARYYLSLSRLAAALEALLSAGVTIIEAWELAATASGSPAIRRTVLAWRPLVNAGQTPAEVVNASRRFPELFTSQYTAGEISGKLDETLGRLHKYYQEEGSRKLHAVAQWTPRMIYFLIVFLIAWRILAFYTNYFKQVGAAAGF